LNTICRLAAGAIALALSAAALAGQPVALLTPVEYEAHAAVLHKTKDACKLDEIVQAALVDEYKKRSGPPAVMSAMEGVVVHVTIVGSGGIGGGGWTGPKSLVVRAEELKDGQLVRSRGFRSSGRDGLLGAFEGTCTILEGLSRKVAKDLVAWTGVETDAAFDKDVAVRAAAAASAAEEAASDAK